MLTITDKNLAATAKTVEEGRAAMKIDWEKMGSVFSMGERAMMFFENEAEPLLKREGLLDLPTEKDDEFYQLLVGDRWMKAWLEKMQALDKDKPVEEIIEQRITHWKRRPKKRFQNGTKKRGIGSRAQRQNFIREPPKVRLDFSTQRVNCTASAKSNTRTPTKFC